MDFKHQDIINDRSCLTEGEIQSYLKKTASWEERFVVENHLLDCDLCSAALEGYTQHTNEILYSKTDPRRLNWLYLAAATLLLLIGAVAFRGYYDANSSGTTFAEFYQKPSWDTQTRGDEKSDQYTQAIKSYNQGHYAAAVVDFEELVKTYPEDNQLRLYKGIADLESDNYTQAEEELQTVRINSDIYYEEASWYLALLKIKTKNKTEALQLLDELISIKNGYYIEKATSLKKEL